MDPLTPSPSPDELRELSDRLRQAEEALRGLERTHAALQAENAQRQRAEEEHLRARHAAEGQAGEAARLLDEARAENRRQAETLALLDTLLEHLPAGFGLLDRSLRFVRVNAALARVSGVPAAEHLGRPVGEVAPDLARALEPHLHRVLETGESVLDHELSTSAGPGAEGPRHWVVSLYPVGVTGGEAIGVGILFIEMTGRRRSEQAVRQAQMLDAIGQFAGGVAHEFNNLLTVICGYAELLAGCLDPAGSGPGYLEQLRQAAGRAARRTVQLLAVGRRLLTVPQQLDLNDLARDSAPQLRLAAGPAVELRLELDPALGPAYADPGQIQQALLNLVQNAREAMPGGGVLTVGTAHMPDDPAGAAACLWVRDTGVGMTEDVRARLFEPFFTTKGSGPAAGLGLATVQGIVRQHGGRVEVETAPGRGSTFRMYLPTPPAAAAAAAAPAAAAPRGAGTILLAEDEPAVRRLVVTVLQAQGYTVLEAGDGREALAVWEAHGPAVDLLLTDLLMPHVGGNELAARLRQRRPGLPVVFMSGYTDDEQIRAALLTGEAPLLKKPFRTADLIRQVRQALGG
jgi:PAS domain S-box-containing protein